MMSRSKSSSKSISRRRVLQGLGGLSFALPFLHKFYRPARAGVPGVPLPRRLVVMAYPMGTMAGRARPIGAGTDFTLPYITAPLEPFRDRCLFVSNCDNEVMNLNAQHAYGHPGKREGALTGTLLTSAFGGDGANHVDNVLANAPGAADGTSPNNESVCHFIGERIRTTQPRPSIDLGVTGSPFESNELPSAFFFEGAANPVTMQLNPARAFDQLFGGFTGGEPNPALEALRARGLSVLDAVHDSFTDLRQGLDARDRAILDDHADHVRELEQRLSSEATATCEVPAQPPTVGSPPSYDPYRGMNMSELAAYQIPLLARGLGCDIAPVGRLEFTAQDTPRFGIPSVDDELDIWSESGIGWHAAVHGDPSPIDGLSTRPTPAQPDHYAPVLLDGYRFFVQRFADLLTALQGIPEGPDGLTALDHTLCVLTSDFGDGSGHSANKTLWVMAGNTGQARSGYHARVGPDEFFSPSDHNTSRLLVSLIRMFGLTERDGSPIDEFGLQGFSTGVIDELFG
jgi:uncharacterized protein DUF1552